MQELKNTRMKEWKNAIMQKNWNARIQESKNTRKQEYMKARIQENKITWIQESNNDLNIRNTKITKRQIANIIKNDRQNSTDL